MTWMDFDISFCHGKDAKGEPCTKRDTCRRYWTEMTAKEAEKLGIKYNSFILINDVKDCEYYVG